MKRLLIAGSLFLPNLVFAQGPPSSGAPGVDWLYQFSNNLTNLTTQNGGALTQVGLTELSFISLIVLVSMVVKWSTSTMTLSFHSQPVRAGDLTQFLLRLVVCCLLENYWVNPLPGVSFGLNHLFSYFAQVIVAALDHNSLDTLTTLFKTAGDNTPMPAVYAIPQWICYFLVQLLLGLASAILFLINVSSFIFYGVCALFGPIFIPFYMASATRAKFFQFVDVLLSFAMIRAVAAAFIFVWAGFLNGFILQTFNQDYSIEKWLANLIPCAAVFIAFILNMVFVPDITQLLFGGGSGMAGRVGQITEAVIVARTA
jgi:predicted ABC-type exoprotein transport system permease subunit